MGGQAKGYLAYNFREDGPVQSELPKVTSQELLMGGYNHVEDKFVGMEISDPALLLFMRSRSNVTSSTRKMLWH
jgi:hypothetical protein